MPILIQSLKKQMIHSFRARKHLSETKFSAAATVWFEIHFGSSNCPVAATALQGTTQSEYPGGWV